MPKIIKNGRVYGGAPSESVWEGTQEQYDAIVNKDPNIIYYITDGAVEPIPATDVSYSGTTSGLSASTVQGAIDEVDERLDGIYPLYINSLTANTGYSVDYIMGAKIGKFVSFSCRCSKTNGWTTGWHTVATLSTDLIPNGNANILVPLVNSSQGGTLGMGGVAPSPAGELRIYCTTTGNITLSFTISYLVN